MQICKLGNNLEVSAFGLGRMSTGFGNGPAGDEQEMIKVIRAAVQPVGQGFPYRQDRGEDDVRQVRLPQHRTELFPEGEQGEPRAGRTDRPDRRAQSRHACADRAATARMQMVGARYSEGSQRMIDRCIASGAA